MFNEIIENLRHKVARVGAAMIGVFHHADGRLEVVGAGEMDTRDLDELARLLSLIALSLQKKANALGMQRRVNFSEAGIFSGNTAMRTYDIDGAAEFLKISTHTLGLLARTGVISGAKVGRSWVFSDEALESYLRDEITRQTDSRRPPPKIQTVAPIRRRGRIASPPPPLY